MDYRKLGLEQSLIDATTSIVSEKTLHPNQEKLDKNKNGKLDAHDFKLLRKEEEELDEKTDISSIRAKYKENENNNNHSENAVLLAKHFGSKSDQNKAAKAMAHRDKHNGYGADPEGRHYSKMSHEVHSKLYHHIKEEEELDEVDMGQADRTLRSQDKSGNTYHVKDKSGKIVSTHDNQSSAIKAALKNDDHKVVKEQVEQIDELSKKTMGDYVLKSHDQLKKHTATVNMKYGRGDNDAFSYERDKDNMRKTANREKGVKTAVKKLTKEQVEEIEALAAKHGLGE
jgi:hypothetical protein